MSHVLPGQVPTTHVRAANCTLLVMFALGLAEGSFVPHETYLDIYLLGALTVGYLLSLWYRNDAETRGIRRSGLMSGAIVLAPLLALPCYLLRSRPEAERGIALGAFFGLLALMPLARLAGVGVHLALRQAGA